MPATKTSVTRGAEQNAAALEWLLGARAVEQDPDACRDLWVAVLDDARMLVSTGGRGLEPDGRGDWSRNTTDDRRRARDWMLSRDEDVGTFRWICTLLDWDADVVRERVFRGRAA